MRLSKRGKALVYAVTIVAVIIALSFLAWYLLQPRYVLTAKMVTKQPMIDGKSADQVWAGADTLTIPQSGGAAVDMKSIYTPDMIFFLARFKSKAPNMTERAWTFDGKNWRIGASSDQIGLFFEINNTMPDFARKGFDAMTFGLKNEDSMWEFGTVGPSSVEKEWSGARQEADYWIWGSGVTNPWGKAADLYFSINREYVASPTTNGPILLTRWDSFTAQRVLSANSTVWQEAYAASEGAQNQAKIRITPSYMYKKGKTFKNDPYPVFEDLTQIPEGTSFKKGDQLPYIYFDGKAKGKWGGSWDDVNAKGVWKDGYWTVEIGRRLNTGNGDDIKFQVPDKDAREYWFGILTRSGGLISKSAPARLRLTPRGDN